MLTETPMLTGYAALQRAAEQASGMKKDGDGWYGPVKAYGIERGADGLWHAVGIFGNRRSAVGVDNDVAAQLVTEWCPLTDETQYLLDEGEMDAVLLGAATFVSSWDMMAQGTKQSLEIAKELFR